MTASIESWLPETSLRLTVRPGASADTITEASPRFVRHCIEEFEWLAAHQPGELARIALAELNGDPVLVSQAAEAMALSHHAALMTPVLLKLLEHPRPFVRESALIGLSPFIASSLQARDRVRALAETDGSPGVREAAADVLMLL